MSSILIQSIFYFPVTFVSLNWEYMGLQNWSKGPMVEIPNLWSELPTNQNPQAILGVSGTCTRKMWHHVLSCVQNLFHEAQRKFILAAIRHTQQYMKTKAFKEAGVKELKRIHHPLCEEHKYDSDEYWECYIRSDAIHMFHPVGTCRMGRKEDPTAVVDSQLR